MPEVSGTWTGATHIAVVVYRGAAHPTAVSNDGFVGSDGNSSTLTYAALTPTTVPAAGGTAWYLGFASHKTATNVETAPTGMSNVVQGGTEIVVHDTGSAVSTNWTSRTVSVNASSLWMTFVVQVPASGTISRVGAAAGNGTSITIPAGHTPGDLILVYAVDDTSTSPPSLGSGFTSLTTRSAVIGIGGTIGYRVATVGDFLGQVAVY